MSKIFGDDWPLMLALALCVLTCVFLAGWVLPEILSVILEAAD